MSCSHVILFQIFNNTGGKKIVKCLSRLHFLFFKLRHFFHDFPREHPNHSEGIFDKEIEY